MRAGVLILALHLALMAFPPAARAQDTTVKWPEIRGLILPAAVAATVPNSTVGSGTGVVPAAGLPWLTTQGSASINLRSGLLKFNVKGLLLAAGNSIGTRGAVGQVKGTLVCDTNGSAGGGNSVLVDTDLVDLDAQGAASFVGNVGPLPVACSESDIAFVIRTTGGSWIAHGAVRRP